MKYKKYNGKDKYHFRVYKRYGHHPFVVVMVGLAINPRNITILYLSKRKAIYLG